MPQADNIEPRPPEQRNGGEEDRPIERERLFDVTVYRRLIRDPKVSHGAFRLFHALRDRANDRNECYPSQRTLAGDMHCKKDSLKRWTEELVAGNYLAIVGRKARGVFVYRILSASPKGGTLLTSAISVPERGNTDLKPASPILDSSVPERGDSSVPERGIQSNNTEVRTEVKRERFAPPTLQKAIALAVANGMPEAEGNKFFNWHEKIGWRGVVSAKGAMDLWRNRYDEHQQTTQTARPAVFLYQQIKSAKDVIENLESQLKSIPVPMLEEDAAAHHAAREKRAPIRKELEQMKAKLADLNRQAADARG